MITILINDGGTKMSNSLKRFIAIMLIAMFCLITCPAVISGASETGTDPFSGNAIPTLPEIYDQKGGADDDETVTIMVKLEDDPLLAVTSLDNATKSTEVSALLKSRRADAVKAVSEVVGKEIQPLFTYELLFNGFSFEGSAGLIDDIAKLDGIADCYRSMEWGIPEVIDEEDAKVNSSADVVNADILWEAGYTGEGMAIAILDTGIRIDHSNFANAPDDPRYSVESIQEIIETYDLTSEQLYVSDTELTGELAYYSEKIPFRFNYVTGTTDVSHATAANDHGTHVSSIAAGDDSIVRGIAYNAQIISMQVFNGASAAWSTILAALEDCTYLGVDCVNMSLSAPYGFTTGTEDMERVYTLLYETGVNVHASAGNSFISGSGNSFSFGQALALDPDNGIVGTPATLYGNLCVASSLNSAGGRVSDFSSWGTTSDLKIKPEIMAPGSLIRAATDPDYSDNEYGTKSGTSMSSPDMAGCSALLLQYLKSEYPEMTAKERMLFSRNLMLSTAHPAYYSSGLPYSPRAQGAGLVDVEASMNTTVYLAVEGSDLPKLEIGDDPERTGLFTLSLELINFGSIDQSYVINTNVQTEEGIRRSVHGVDVYSMNSAPYDLTENSVIGGDTEITVPANGSVEVTITVDMSAYGEMLDEIFPNGIYIEGFVQFENTGDGADLSAPYLGFYGSWNEAPVIDRTFYWDILGGEDSWSTHAYPNLAATETTSGNYYLGANPFLNTDSFLLDRISISPNGDKLFESVDRIYTGLLRNCSTLVYTVTNAETDEVVMAQGYRYVRKGAYVLMSGFMPAGSIYAQFAGWSGEGLSEGETAIISIDAALDYEGFVPEENDCASWSFPVTIDTTAPEVLLWRVEDGKLLLYVTDAHYLAYVGVYSSSDYSTSSLIDETAVSEETRGAVSVFAFDIGNHDTVYVKLGDYAYNIAKLELTGEGGSMERVALTGIDFNVDALNTYTALTEEINLITTPADANNYNVQWSSEDTGVAVVRGDFFSANITGISQGTTVITATATDRETGDTFTKEITVTVVPHPTIGEALNAEGGNYSFTVSGMYPWVVDLVDAPERVTLKTTNVGIDSSNCVITSETISLAAGDVVSFEWAASTQLDKDILYFYVNNHRIASISGITDWETYSYVVEEDGEYSFKWIYLKSPNDSSGDDYCRLDNFHVVSAEFDIGDVDGNGVVNTTDALHILRHSLGLTLLTGSAFDMADVNGDDTIDTSDALLVLRMALGSE